MKNKQLLWFYILSTATYTIQGLEGIPGSALFFYLKENLHFNPSTIMYISSITGIAWLIKPILGYFIDSFFTKKIWVYASLVGSLLMSLFLGLTPLLILPLLILFLTLASANTAIRDVSVDGMACCQGKETNTTEKIQTIQWTSITVASILVGLGGGYIAEHFNYQIGFLCLIPIYLGMLFIVKKYKPSPTINNCNTCLNAAQCHKHTFEPSLLVTNCPNHAQIIDTPIKFLENLKSYKILFTNKKFLIGCLFLLLYNYSPSFGTPLSFIERDIFGWSKQWMGILGAIVSCFEILGAIVFYKLCKKINYTKWLYASVIIGACSSLAYLYFTPITAIIYGIIFSFIGMNIRLMMMSFMAKMSITGKESTSFALACSIVNLAGTLSTLSGGWLYSIIGLTPLILLSTVTSFACLPLIKKLEIK